jgi:circadian clock protein KaiC
MPEEQFLVIQMHELLSYLRQRGALIILVVAQTGIMGAGMQAPVDLSYLSDTVVLLRYYEIEGRIAKAISVLKRRSGRHSTEIRELVIDRPLSLGKPLGALQGIMTGVPVAARK